MQFPCQLKFQKEYSYSIGSQIVDIKRPEELDDNLLTVNEKLYKKYSNEYICSNPSYSNPYQEIINEFS